MAKIKKQEDYAAELQKSFDQWEHYKTHGGSDPFWADGCNMNLIRNHVIYYKGKIRETIAPNQYPAIYFRETPPVVNQDYMARTDEIRAAAIKALETYKADEHYQFLCRRSPRLTPKQRDNTCIDNVIGYVTGLEKAIITNDFITMRRHECGGYINSFSSCAERVRTLKPPENEQLNLFVDYSHDDEDEWEEEY